MGAPKCAGVRPKCSACAVLDDCRQVGGVDPRQGVIGYALPVAGLITSGVLASSGAPHGFSTRAGGVSAGVFASLNFGNPGDLVQDRRDPPGNIAENYRRMLAAAGCAG